MINMFPDRVDNPTEDIMSTVIGEDSLFNEDTESIVDHAIKAAEKIGTNADEIRSDWRDALAPGTDNDGNEVPVSDSERRLAHAHAVGRSLNAIGDTASRLDKAISKHNTVNNASIVARARNSIIQFPIYTSQSLRANEATIIARLLERVYVTFVQTVLAQNQLIDEEDANNLVFLKSFHTNIHESAEKLLNKYYEAIDDFDQMMQDSIFYSEKLTENCTVEFRVVPTDYDVLIKENARLLHEPLEGFFYLKEADGDNSSGGRNIKKSNLDGNVMANHEKGMRPEKSSHNVTRTSEEVVLSDNDLRSLALDSGEWDEKNGKWKHNWTNDELRLLQKNSREDLERMVLNNLHMDYAPKNPGKAPKEPDKPKEPDASHYGDNPQINPLYQKAKEEYDKKMDKWKTQHANWVKDHQKWETDNAKWNRYNDEKNQIMDDKENADKKLVKVIKDVKQGIRSGNVPGHVFRDGRYCRRNTTRREVDSRELKTPEVKPKVINRAVDVPVLLKDADVKKINDILPYSMEATFRMRTKTGAYDEVKFIVGIKSVIHPIDVHDLSEDLEEIITGNIKSLRRIKYKTGEISFKDYFLNMKSIKADAAKSINYNKRWINTCKRLAEYAKTHGSMLKVPGKLLAGQGNAIPNGTLVLTRSDVIIMTNETGIDISEVANAKRLAKGLFLIGIVIVDSGKGTMNVLFPDKDTSWDVQSLATIDSELARTDNSQLMKELNRMVNR